MIYRYFNESISPPSTHPSMPAHEHTPFLIVIKIHMDGLGKGEDDAVQPGSFIWLEIKHSLMGFYGLGKHDRRVNMSTHPSRNQG